MTPEPSQSKRVTPEGIAVRAAGLVMIVVLASWAAHLLKDALDLTMMPNNEKQVHRLLMIGAVAYIGLLALPFVPGAEIGIAMLTAFGAAIAPLVYAATVAAMMLAFLLGRLLPATTLAWLLSLMRLRKASDLVSRAALLPPKDRLSLLLDRAPPRTVGLALRHRYVALAILVNTPGNALIGGGGGIMMMAGMSGIFTPIQTFIAIAVAVSPVPIAVMVFGF
ncbi:hypothetical protein GCM10011363_34310 [Marivita lacus]|uniref:TVP38/TMEM64 family membrane protein n=1 Tax=Marivita lacus TaxID=1323742 RepID=A0ABQ1KYU2_9RHOB|nr:hypothetical protein [Marivita lacus]GGC14952.1 hypothetical protein GCM10011363_34310 [Marivita lacus]